MSETYECSSCKRCSEEAPPGKEYCSPRCREVDKERQSVFERAERAIHDRSGKRDDPEDSFGRIADFWSTYLGYDVDPVDVADMMILLKMARSAGGYYERDNWADVAGYSFHADRICAKERGEWRGSRSSDESTDEVVYDDGDIRVTENDIHRP